MDQDQEGAVITAESELRRYRTEAGTLRQNISKASSTVAAMRKKATAASAAASRSSNPSTVRMKTSEAERATKQANEAETKRAGFEQKLSNVETKLLKAQEKWERERQTAQDRALRDLALRTTQAASQFNSVQPPSARRAVETAPSTESAITPQNAAVTTPATAPARDIFLSHASEDKDEIARPLKDALEALEVSVWFDEMQIKVGQSIRQEIERGIASCRFGVVIISPHFFRKTWTNAELDALFSRKMDSGQPLVLPIWHHVSKDEVLQHSPLLAGILALNTSTMSTDEIAVALAEAVRTTTETP